MTGGGTTRNVRCARASAPACDSVASAWLSLLNGHASALKILPLNNCSAWCKMNNLLSANCRNDKTIDLQRGHNLLYGMIHIDRFVRYVSAD
jgi:hypothetical protein